MTGAPALGVLDWGIGGLGFVKALWARRPDAAVLYLSDSGAVPYGKLPAQELLARVQAAVDFLCAQGAERVVIACNAASSVAARLHSAAPITPIVVAAVACVPDTTTGTLWVLGGKRIVQSQIYQHALERPGRVVRGRIAQPLSAHVEAGCIDGAAFARDLARVIAPIAPGDSLLLACTHYPAFLPALRKALPASPIFDPADTLADSIVGALTDAARPGPSQFLTTGSPEAMRSGAAAAWQLALGDVTQVALHG
jgi:glutamate racemase